MWNPDQNEKLKKPPVVFNSTHVGQVMSEEELFKTYLRESALHRANAGVSRNKSGDWEVVSRVLYDKLESEQRRWVDEVIAEKSCSPIKEVQLTKPRTPALGVEDLEERSAIEEYGGG